MGRRKAAQSGNRAWAKQLGRLYISHLQTSWTRAWIKRAAQKSPEKEREGKGKTNGRPASIMGRERFLARIRGIEGEENKQPDVVPRINPQRKPIFDVGRMFD